MINKGSFYLKKQQFNIGVVLNTINKLLFFSLMYHSLVFNDQCLKEEQDKNAKVTQRGWFWRGMCAACRFKKCVQVGMKYQRKQLAPIGSKSLSSSSTSSVMVEDWAFDHGGHQELTLDVDNINYQWLFDFSEQMKRQQQIQQEQEQQRQCQILITLWFWLCLLT